mmetsp:Transcript_3738/g.5480  ORF Transcript_3738/g.5480 Transcript_3738/m.5480 type:complete len:264 (+) Transcript_3738:82-873(+)|eukprot:CAMPEP_0194217888 /NCGR_PEP_ID=MMETSP0156-20130528/22463_1 /TAXON_ID=33649 /ORGANISM="Thalassionema nitzschioides, Strain L26-B" /LENGTH=263 /DNA_ID=CAMNT_0038947047 /DNA_START=26 /DNA_END=817 /DNA_ORIENTATION=-
MNKEVFIVQRCWQSGAKEYQPLDYLRIFRTQRDAEEAAYHSALAWSKYHNQADSTEVKPVVLPLNQSQSSSLPSQGFVSYGSLFWVRSSVAHVAGYKNNYHHHDEAFAVLTDGVIGGTGNQDWLWQRGNEETTGRIFVGGSLSRSAALQACNNIVASGVHKKNTFLVTVPLGKPCFDKREFLKDWPPQVLHPDLVDSSAIGNSQLKRESNRGSENDQAQANNMECTSLVPQLQKRRRLCASEFSVSGSKTNPSYSQDQEMSMC